jgi:hypothetical protein
VHVGQPDIFEKSRGHAVERNTGKNLAGVIGICDDGISDLIGFAHDGVNAIEGNVPANAGSVGQVTLVGNGNRFIA